MFVVYDRRISLDSLGHASSLILHVKVFWSDTRSSMLLAALAGWVKVSSHRGLLNSSGLAIHDLTGVDNLLLV